MTTFDEREAAFENKFAHDEELKFRATVIALKHVALWAASKLGKSGQDAERYAENATLCDLRDSGHAIFINQMLLHLGAEVSEDEIRKKIAAEYEIAHDRVLNAVV